MKFSFKRSIGPSGYLERELDIKLEKPQKDRLVGAGAVSRFVTNWAFGGHFRWDLVIKREKSQLSITPDYVTATATGAVDRQW